MRTVAERMRRMREKQQAAGLREIRLIVPDARSAAVRARVAEEIKALNRADEEEAFRWIESVSEFDNDATG